MSKTWGSILVVLVVLVSVMVTGLRVNDEAGSQEESRDLAGDVPQPMGPGCPTDDTYITDNTTLDGETCYVNDTAGDGILILETPNIVLDCNYTTLIGDGTGVAIMIRTSGVIVKNCRIGWYEVGIMANSSHHIGITHNEISHSNSTGIHVDRNSYSNIVNDNVVNDTQGLFYLGIPGAAIHVAGLDNVVASNELVSNEWGISIKPPNFPDQEQNNIVQWNNITFSSLGIHVHGNANLIANNTVDSSFAGMSVFMDSRENVIVFNHISGNDRGVHIEGHRNYFGNNTVYANDGYGISLEVAFYNTFMNNTVESNGLGSGNYGLSLSFWTRGNTFAWNLFHANYKGGSISEDSGPSLDPQYNSFHHNSFIGNTHGQITDMSAGQNDWNSSCAGNYWADYAGIDADGDGIGDTPYVIDSGGLNDAPSVDFLPLMSPGNDPCLAPGILNAALTGPAFGDIEITWKSSPGDGQPGQSVFYRVMRSIDFVFPLVEIGVVMGTGSTEYSFTDPGMGHGQPDTVLYSIWATDQNGRVGSTRSVTKYPHDLQAGMQLISTPLTLFDNRAQSVLQTVSYDDVWIFDVGDPTDHWKSYSKSKPYSDPIAFEIGTGVWVNVEQAGTWTVVGMFPLSRSIPLKSGWNLVGYPSLFAKTVNEAFAGTPYVAIEAYDPIGEPFHLSELSGSDYLESGRGYWVQVSQDVVWNV